MSTETKTDSDNTKFYHKFYYLYLKLKSWIDAKNANDNAHSEKEKLVKLGFSISNEISVIDKKIQTENNKIRASLEAGLEHATRGISYEIILQEHVRKAAPIQEAIKSLEKQQLELLRRANENFCAVNNAWIKYREAALLERSFEMAFRASAHETISAMKKRTRLSRRFESLLESYELDSAVSAEEGGAQILFKGSFFNKIDPKNIFKLFFTEFPKYNILKYDQIRAALDTFFDRPEFEEWDGDSFSSSFAETDEEKERFVSELETIIRHVLLVGAGLTVPPDYVEKFRSNIRKALDSTGETHPHEMLDIGTQNDFEMLCGRKVWEELEIAEAVEEEED